MNEALITNWNNVVKPNDTVFHLGDFAFGGSYIWNNVLSRLNGNIHLILGNHDEKNIREGYMTKFKYVGYQLRLIIENRVVYLNHYPFLCYGGTYRGSNYAIQLFGKGNNAYKNVKRPSDGLFLVLISVFKEIFPIWIFAIKYFFFFFS